MPSSRGSVKMDGNLLPLLLQVTFASPTIWNCLIHIFGLSMLSNVVKETAVTMALNIGKKPRRLNELAKHRNQICKTRHSEKPASFKLVQLAPRSFCHAVDGIWEQYWKFNFSRGEWYRLLNSSNAAASSMSSANTTCRCFCAMVLFSSSCTSLPVSSGAIAAPYPQCPGRRLQAGPSGHVVQSNVDLRDSLGVFVPAKWTVMAMICNDFINFILTLCKVWMDFQPKSVPHQAGQWQTMVTNAFSTWVRINPYNVKIYFTTLHSSLCTLKQAGFYPWLTCPPRIWCKNQPPTTETSVGCASRNNPWQLLLWDAGCITQRGPRATGNSLPRTGRNLRATTKVQLLQGRLAQDFQQVSGPIGTFGVSVEAPGVIKRGLWG